MADNQLQNAVQELLTCAFCLEEAIQPKSLHCQHTFCYTCLKKYFSTKDKKDVIQCPTCRQWSQVPSGGLVKFQVNFFFNQLKDTAANTPSVSRRRASSSTGPSCSSCDCDGSVAVAFCESCQYICTECERDHQTVRVLRRHKLVSVDEAEESRKKSLPSCVKHPDELMKLFCEDCNTAICCICHSLYHGQHKCTELTSKAKQAKNELKKVLEQVHDHTRKSRTAEVILKEKTAKIDNDAIEVKKKVHKALKDRQDLMCHDVDQACLHVRNQCKGEADRLSVILATLESIELCGVKLLEHGNPADYLLTVPVLIKQLHDNNPDKVINLTDQVDLSSVKHQMEQIKNPTQISVESENNLRILAEENISLRKQLAKARSDLQQLHIKSPVPIKVHSPGRSIIDHNHSASSPASTPGSMRRAVQKSPSSAAAFTPSSTYQVPLAPRQPPGGTWERIDGNFIRIACHFPVTRKSTSPQTSSQQCQVLTMHCCMANDREGSEVALLMKRAFDARILFTVKSDMITWHAVVFIRGSKFALPYVDKKLTKDKLATLGIK